ncbi:MAG TPA: 50S ribosomal protein L9 [Chloroflexi bacterium]|jgi:large subunit ribosomal protein L9|nr:50S ribosomal protein L9 [Chloroflexota bacterium]
MEVLLLKEVKRLGKAGEVRRVADGYARNYLIPRGLAVPATDAARRQVAEREAARARAADAEKATAEAQAAALENVELVFKVKSGESGRLYGSITSADIAEQLAERIGEPVDKRKVMLDEPIKEIGTSKVDVKLHTDVKISVTVIVEGEDVS